MSQKMLGLGEASRPSIQFKKVVLCVIHSQVPLIALLRKVLNSSAARSRTPSMASMLLNKPNVLLVLRAWDVGPSVKSA